MSSTTLRQRVREATWNAIVEAAEQVASVSGVSDASLQAVAESAGVAVGTIYNYFEDKDRLFEAVFVRRREELFNAIDAASKEHAGEPFEQQLDAFVRAIFVYFDERRAFLRIALDAEHIKAKVFKGEDGRKRPAMQQLQERAGRIVRIGSREGRLRDGAADLIPTILVSIVRGVLRTRSHDDRPLSPETEQVVSLFLKGAAR